MNNIGLCIAERYYKEGMFRVEWFTSEKHLNQYRRGLEDSTTHWILGEEIPPRKKVR